MSSALLRGRESLRIGGIDLIAEERVAIAISRGGAPKRYPHTDPNEDGAAFATGPGGSLLAVSDGHGGFEASEVALDHLLESPAGQWTDQGRVTAPIWRRHALAALVDANTAILSEKGLQDTDPARRRFSRTTLALAVVRPAEDRILFAAMGDSHLFRVTREGVEDLAAEGPIAGATWFLGHGPESVQTLEEKAAIGSRPLAGTRALVLATDGLSERLIGVDHPATEVAALIDRAREAAPALRPAALARGVLELALAAHRRNASGDNIAAAVIWLED